MISETLTLLQNKIINAEAPAETDKLITLQSRGINAQYSVLSFTNNYCECYLYNLCLENTLKSNDHIIYTDYKFIERHNIIGYWPLQKDTVPQIINGDYLSKPAIQYTFNKQSVEFSETDNIPALKLNTADLTRKVSNIPGYLWLDQNAENSSENTVKPLSEELKNIIYNKNKVTPQTTLIFWGYKTETDSGNNPFISDYNINTRTGLYISHEQIVKNYENYNNNAVDTQEVFVSDYPSYDSQFLNNWVMYVFEIQHANSDNPVLNENLSGSTLPWTKTNYFKEVAPVPEEGKMRINIRAYYKNADKETNGVLLLPTQDNITNNVDTSFVIPVLENNSNLNFFASKLSPQATINNIDGWQLWNGYARNILMLNRFLSDYELKNLFNQGINEFYDWETFGEYEIIKQINTDSYLGSLYVYNTNNLNISGNKFKQNIKNLTAVSFD